MLWGLMSRRVMKCSLTKQLIEGMKNSCFKYRCNGSHEETYKYGIRSLKAGQKMTVNGNGLLAEKPKPEDAPSNLAIIGRYNT